MSDPLPKCRETYLDEEGLVKLLKDLKFPSDGIEIGKWLCSTRPLNSFNIKVSSIGQMKAKYLEEIAVELHRRKVYLTVPMEAHANFIDNIPVLEEVT